MIVLPYDDEVAVQALVTRHRHELACVIYDPKAGILPQRKAFVESVREITRQNDVLLIFDEIVGFRVGTGGLQWHEVTKDERVVGKALGEVLPVLRSETPDESSEDCEWCRYVKSSVAV